MLTNLTQRLVNFLSSSFSAASKTLDRDLVVFAGREENPEGNTYEFGIYSHSGQGDNYVWLPVDTINPDVMEVLDDMEIGQFFKVIEEESGGALGTTINQISVLDDMPVVSLGENPSPIIELEGAQPS